MAAQIGRLERVALREVWKHEAYDFTQWLRDNIDVLNEALGLSLINVENEQAAGSFSVDLVAEDGNGGTVIIENQLEKSNHDHLGKLITYLTAMAAKAAIWIVSEPRPEHVAAIAWLNEATSADFYLVKVEAVKIAGSPAAPLLTVIVGPSQETKTVGRTKQEMADREVLRLNWWQRLVVRPGAKLHAHITPNKYSWMGTSIGFRGLNLNYVVTKDEVGAELYIDRGKDAEVENKSIFDQLHANKAEIEKSFGGQIKWERLPDKRACRLRVNIAGGYLSPDEDWDRILDQICEVMNRLEAALKPHIKKLKIDN